MSIKSFIFLRFLNMNKQQQLKLAAQGKHMDVDEARKRLRSTHGLFKLFEKPRPEVTISEKELDGIYCYHAKPQGPTNKVILYLHGGGYVVGLQDSAPHYRYFIAELAHLAKAEVFAPEYRLGPEHPHPAAIDDAYKCYLTLLARGIKPSDIFISGDSAGGGLTLALLLKIRDEGTPLPKAALPISPWADLALTGESMKARADVDILLTEAGLSDMADYFLNGQSPTDPYASPFYGTYEGLPPMMILVGGKEVLFDDTIRVAEKAKTAGVDVTVDIDEDMFHIYPAFGGIFKNGKDATQRMVAFMEKHTD